MKTEVALMAVVLAAGLVVACQQVARAGAPDLGILRSEDGTPASRYTSTHRLRCGGRMFELAVDSPGPVKVVELKVDGREISAAQLRAINALAPARSWFHGLTSSCTSARQSLTLHLSSSAGMVAIPVSFEGGTFVRAGAERM